jgi:hypothetical protein
LLLRAQGLRLSGSQALWVSGSKTDALRFGSGRSTHMKPYMAISAIIFALVAIAHLMRIAQGWQVQVGEMGVAMSVSWVALGLSVVLAVWGAMLLRR